MTALADLYRDHRDDPRRALLHLVAELLLDHDERVALWRHHHTLMAAREIGSRHGTGGSRGVEYLQGTQGKRFYPDLWEVRAKLDSPTERAADHADDLVVRRALDHVPDGAGARHLVLRAWLSSALTATSLMPGLPSRISVAARTPPPPGMLKSSRTMSGRRRAASSIAWSASSASPTSSNPGSFDQRGEREADHRVVVGDQQPDRVARDSPSGWWTSTRLRPPSLAR